MSAEGEGRLRDRLAGRVLAVLQHEGEGGDGVSRLRALTLAYEIADDLIRSFDVRELERDVQPAPQPAPEHGLGRKTRRRRASNVLTEPNMPAVGTKTQHAPPASARSVLLVDDDEHVSRALRRALEARGCTVDVAHDGLSGLERCRARRPRVVVCDQRMPGLHGRDVITTILSEMGKDAPTVFVLSSAPGKDVARLVDPARIFTKPVRFEVLYEALRPHLEEREAE